MSRLKKIADRPRENRKKVSYLLEIALEVDNSDGKALEDLNLFKEWMNNKFTKWDKSILEYYLYEYGLLQNPDSDKYYLDFRIKELMEDDTLDSYKNKEENEKDEK